MIVWHLDVAHLDVDVEHVAGLLNVDRFRKSWVDVKGIDVNIVQTKAHVTRYIFAPNIEIKIYCDKNIFGPWTSIGQGKLLTKNKSSYINKNKSRYKNKNKSRYKNKKNNQGMFFQSLPWLGIEIYVSKIAISFYHNIAILCVKMSSVTRAFTVNEKMLG